MKLWDEFKAFAFKGNMLDLAIAVVIGAAFGKVISSLVSDVIMPLVGLIPLAKDGYQAWMLGPVKIRHLPRQPVGFLDCRRSGLSGVGESDRQLDEEARGPRGPPPAVKECPMCLSVIPQKARKRGSLHFGLAVMAMLRIVAFHAGKKHDRAISSLLEKGTGTTRVRQYRGNSLDR